MELKQYMKIIQKKLWLIAAIVITACLGAGVNSYVLTTPIYQANAKLIVNQTTFSDGSASLNPGSVQTNIMLINSYKEIIQSAAIMNKVVEQHPELNKTLQQLSENISVTSASQSQVMDLTYRDTSYEQAALTVNAIANVFKQQIPNIMKIDNVTILNEAIPDAPANPININPVMNILIMFLFSFVVSLGIVFLLDYMDNTYRSEAELEESLGIPILAVVAKIRNDDLRPKKSINEQQKQGVGEGKYAAINR